MELSQEMQQKIQSFQEAQQQTRVLLSQKYQIELQLRESQNAIEELSKLSDTEAYKIVGQILIKTPKDAMIPELKEKIETMELRLKTIEKQEKKLTEKMKELQEYLQKGFSGASGGATAG